MNPSTVDSVVRHVPPLMGIFAARPVAEGEDMTKPQRTNRFLSLFRLIMMDASACRILPVGSALGKLKHHQVKLLAEICGIDVDVLFGRVHAANIGYGVHNVPSSLTTTGNGVSSSSDITS